MNDNRRTPREKRVTPDRRSVRPSPVKSPSLRPAQLRSDSERRVEEKRPDEKKVSLESLTDQPFSAHAVDERRYSYQPVHEHRPEMRVEHTRGIRLREIGISPATMQDLRERRVEARDLGWNVSGTSIRIGSGR